MADRIGVIDLGSNSGRLVVYERESPTHLEIVEDARVPLRLARDLQVGDAMSEDAVERTLDALREFQAVAAAAGSPRLRVVATSAIREAANSAEVVRRLEHELGGPIQILDGLEEARFAFLGAVHGLPVEDGIVLDLGGGSLELTLFERRGMVDSWSAPLGALRTSGAFLLSDPPTRQEMSRLRKHVRHALNELGVPKLAPGATVVGTGGTVRNVAKIDRRQRGWPVERLHGYVVPESELPRIIRLIAQKEARSRAEIQGLNADRADSIVGGAITIHAALEYVGADALVVSGQGLREGLALAAFELGVPAIPVVQRASLESLVKGFRGWEWERATRRVEIARQLLRALVPDASEDQSAALDHAAYILDIGRSIDYYNRLRHTADIVANADLDGFSHREVALLSAIIREADRHLDLKRMSPLLGDGDAEGIAQAGVLLLLADEIVRRLAGEVGARVEVRERDDVYVIAAPGFSRYGAERLESRFERAFGKVLIIA